MTSASPPAATHFRGKTLTPESPVPVHIPEPQNIPVLMNQNDLVFNNMSTHMEQRYPLQKTAMTEAEGFHHQFSDMFTHAVVPHQTRSSETDEIAQGVDHFDEDTGHEYALAYEGDNTQRQQHDTSRSHLTADDQPSVPSDYETLSNSAKITSTSFTPSQSQNPSTNTIQAITTSFDRSQDTTVSQGPAAATLQIPKEPETQSQTSILGVNGDFVNYQVLLDDLSPSTPTAPALEVVTSTITAASPGTSSPGSVQPPIVALPVPAGLPPRPPPQDKPAIHPNYTPGEDIRSYHNPPAAQTPSASTSYNPQPNSTQRPPQGYIHSNGIAPNGLPPPPVATFQQPLTKPSHVQSSPQEQQYRQRDNYTRNAGRAPVFPSESEDEQPRRPDVERLYEEFLRDEAIYVAEGTWDRFPQGSRLFVGTYQNISRETPETCSLSKQAISSRKRFQSATSSTSSKDTVGLPRFL